MILSVAPGDLMEALIPSQVSLDCIYLWLVEQQNLTSTEILLHVYLSLYELLSLSPTLCLSVSGNPPVSVCVLKKCNYTDIQTFYSCKDIH